VSEYNTKPLLPDPGEEAGNAVTDFKLGNIGNYNQHFYDKYYLSVEMLSLSPVSYNFWKNVSNQEKQSSDLFQTTPGTTSGNMKATGTNQPPPVGLFSASASKTGILVLRLPQGIAPVLGDTITFPCNKFFTHSTSVKPPFW
jgi:hypothetical protein